MTRPLRRRPKKAQALPFVLSRLLPRWKNIDNNRKNNNNNRTRNISILPHKLYQVGSSGL